MSKMGVSNSQKYTISKHATMRIHTRFNIPKNRVKAWVDRFLAQATFFKECENSKSGELQIFKLDDVLAVLNVDEYIVVTAYSYNPFNKTNGLSDEMMNLLRPSLDNILAKEKIHLRDDLDGLMLDLQMDYQAFQNRPKSEKSFEKFLEGIDKINQRIETSQSLIRNIEKLKE